jgi:ATP adenylyltransferase
MRRPAYAQRHKQFALETEESLMERMWSPWRSVHLENMVTGGQSETGPVSVFTRIAGETDRDEQNLVLYRGTKVFVVMNLYPYNNGHLMIVPYREEAEYDRLEREEQIEMALLLDRCIRWLRTALQPDGFNVGFNLGEAAGAGIPRHLHMHVVPRWRGDTNFMPTIADVKVVPEALADTYRRLTAAIREEN